MVNNGEKDELLERAVLAFPKTKYLESGANLGFAGGNNFGLAHCQGDYIYFINNDTEVSPNLLQPVLRCFHENPKVGMVSTKLVYHHDKKTVQYAGATELNPYTMRNEGIGDGELDNGQFDACEPTAFIHGASMIVPRAVIDAVGTMYDDYFLYYEEYDWCQRVKAAGYDIYYCGQSTVYHKESVSTGVNSPLKIYYLTRNRLLFSRRNYDWLTKAIGFLYITCIAMPIHSIKYIAKGKFDLLKAMHKGYFWNLTNQAKAK